MATSETAATPAAVDHAAQPALWQKLTSFHVLMGTLLVGAMFIPLRNFAVDPDVWWHIKVGTTILATHHFPTLDTYSFTANGTPWIAYEWLGEVILALVHNHAGLAGLLLLDLGLTSIILSLLFVLATMRSGNSKAAFVPCLFIIPLIYVNLTLRPQMFGYIFLLVTLIVLELFRKGHSRALWFLPPMYLLWVNIHGSFVLGLFALGAYWACGLVKLEWGALASHVWTVQQRIQLELVALIILLALTITPYGTEVCVYPIDMAFSQPVNVGNIQEWQSMGFSELYGKIFLILLIGLILAQITLRSEWRLEELVLVLVGIIGACIHIRFLLVFVPFCIPAIAAIFSRWMPPYDAGKDKYPINAILVAAVVGAIIYFFPSKAEFNDIMKEKWPVRAVNYLKTHDVPKPMYNNYGYGGYLIYSMSDTNKVFIDGRGDIYERRGVLSDYLHVSRITVAAPAVLDVYGIQSCLVVQDEALRTLLEALPAWQRVYADDISAIFVRRRTAKAMAAIPTVESDGKTTQIPAPATLSVR